MNLKTTYTIIIVIILIGLGLLLMSNNSKTPDLSTRPAIEYVNASDDIIRVTLPYPGAVTGKEFKVIGEARGTWYFEASFPIEVLDKDGNVLVQTHATAQKEWMTEDFVPFEADIKVPESYIGLATLVLHKDNPSDIREKDASMSFPFIIEY